MFTELLAIFIMKVIQKMDLSFADYGLRVKYNELVERVQVYVYEVQDGHSVMTVT